ncbi:MAG: hypothetical protein IT373_13025 [Polyangiaceae bacterium]|nr:hypothetical protein [Polyangiaceae bacterium]
MRRRPSVLAPSVLAPLALALLGAGGAGCSSVAWQAPPAQSYALEVPPVSPASPGQRAGFADDEQSGGTMSLAKKIAQFAPVKLTTDLSKLPASEKAALDKLIAAAKLMDPIFDRQAYAHNPALETALAADTSEAGRAKLAYYRIMRGPWDRQDHFRPFATEVAHPRGAGFYPTDLTEKAWQSYLAAHPGDKTALESLFTVVERQGDKLVAVPFSKAYAAWLLPAAKLLEEAAAATQNPTLKRFLVSRAAAFLSDEYQQSDKDWMDLEGAVEVTIGPYETYEDLLFGLKASFEAFVTVTDPDASQKLAKYKALLPAMEKNLPVPDEVKTTRGRESPIRVVDLVYSAGDARKSVQTIAFNLPNDEVVRKEKGAKKVLLRNVIQTKFDAIMRPIGERILDPSQTALLSSEAFFNETLFHELSHSLGPATVKVDGQDVDVRVAIGPSHSAIEEAKADVMGAYNILFMIKQKQLPDDFRAKLLVSYFAGLFRSVRFGVSEAHGQGSALQVNRFFEEGAATADPATGKLKVDLDKLEASITKLVHDICMLQHAGDRAGVEAMLAKYGVMSPAMKKALDGLGDIPVDLRPIYPAAGETD